MTYLSLALEAWRDGYALRRRRQRYKRYTYGDQWSDPATAADGSAVTEGDLASHNGQQPLTNNLIRQLVKCVIGNFRGSMTAPAPVPAAETAARNALDELDARMLEEFLISGCAIQRVTVEKRMAGEGVWVDNVSPASFFINRFTDPRGLDIELVGMLHSLSFREVMMRYGTDASRAALIKAEYSGADPLSGLQEGVSLGDPAAMEFFSAPRHRCRVIEVWTPESRNVLRCHDPEQASAFTVAADCLESLREVNAARQRECRPEVTIDPRTTMRWHCRIFTPGGRVLEEYDSPYPHGLHPFAVKFYPLTDGEVHSFVEDIIDQQRHINRLITLMDSIMAHSAKGVLLFPAGQKPECMSWQQLGSLWASCNGIIPYEPNRCDGEPRQIISGAQDAGASRLLELQMQMFNQISGVSEAMKGQSSQGASSTSMFDAQVQRSALALLDMLDSFNDFRAARNRLMAGS